ncbi:MAG: sigma-70 family RNA polymerase sigma factor [Marmoricola sp.]
MNIDTISSEVDDTELVLRSRAGDAAALDALYRRHQPAVLAAARALSPDLAEDLTAEAFTRTFDLLLQGRGPDRSVRAYLVTAVRNLRVGVIRKDHRLTFTDELEDREPMTPSAEESLPGFENDLIRHAFEGLSHRDRVALWWTTVEELPVDRLAADWNTSSHAVSQHAFRARESLRQAYLAAHAGTPARESCRTVPPLLSRRVRGRLDAGSAKRRRLERHLAGCAPCMRTGEELARVARRIRSA